MTEVGEVVCTRADGQWTDDDIDVTVSADRGWVDDPTRSSG